MDTNQAGPFINKLWDEDVVPCLKEYIKIPSKSPLFDKDWAANGHIDAAVALLAQWARTKLGSLPGASLEVMRLPNRTPLIFIDVPATGHRESGKDCVLLYGHLDKQPEMTGWSDGLGPWTPVLKEDRLYGRGGADDGYAIFAALSALLTLQVQGTPHARCIILIEGCEESGSYDLPFYVEHLATRIGRPSLVVCLDSGCATYDRLWLTTSLRGMTGGKLTVEVLTEGVHSGDASGVVPDSFRILRQLLSRLEDSVTGNIVPTELYVDIPAERLAQARQCADILGDSVFEKFPWTDGARPISCDVVELILNRAWRPQLAITGADGLPPVASAGNVLRASTSVKVSLRLPPTLDCAQARQFVGALLQRDPPYGAKITFDPVADNPGWDAPPLAKWLHDAANQSSLAAFGAAPGFMSDGVTIPFMGMLGRRYPNAQFLVIGVLGPHSNAHGPNEFLHVPTARKISMVVAGVVAAHCDAQASRSG